MLEAALKELLRELAAATGAIRVAVLRAEDRAAGADGDSAGDDDERARPSFRDVPLGDGAVLRVEGAGDGGEIELGRILEQAARAIRACARRYDARRLPAVAWPDSSSATRDKIVARIAVYLEALLSCQGMANAVVVHHGVVVASARPVAEAEKARLPFISRRVDAEAARREGTSHAEIADEDCFALSFYYDAYLIAFFDAPYAVDFVRHRARLVVREAAELLVLLEDRPTDPASSAPRPE